MSAPVDNRSIWDKVTGVPPPADTRSWVRRQMDAAHENRNLLIGGGVLAGLIVADGVLSYKNAKWMAKWEAEKFYGYRVSGQPAEMKKTLTASQVRRRAAVAGYEAALGTEAPKKLTAARLEAATKLANRSRRDLVRMAGAAGLDGAKAMKKIDIARALAPVVGTKRFEAAIAGGKDVSMRAVKGRSALAAVRPTSVVAAAGRAAAIAALPAKQGVKFAVKEVLHKAPAVLRLGMTTPVGGMMLGGAALYGGYHAFKAWRALSTPATPQRSGYLDDRARSLAQIAPATAPVAAPVPHSHYKDTWIDSRGRNLARRDFSVRTSNG